MSGTGGYSRLNSTTQTDASIPTSWHTCGTDQIHTQQSRSPDPSLLAYPNSLVHNVPARYHLLCSAAVMCHKSTDYLEEIGGKRNLILLVCCVCTSMLSCVSNNHAGEMSVSMPTKWIAATSSY